MTLVLGRRHPAPGRHRHRHRALRRASAPARGACRRPRTSCKAGIDSLVVIGGDGSLSGADVLRQEWRVAGRRARRRGRDRRRDRGAGATAFSIVGLVGSIDNDMSGTDMTIGADTALHRITEAIDAIASTAASHQRTFVVEVMGRHCGYLALMGAIATGASWVLIPENPPDVDDWEATMCERLRTGRKAGRRDSIVIVAEGARDRHGNPITAEHVRQVLQERLDEDVRVTILGHVQRGGAPSAFDRYMSTLLGHAAVEELLASPPGSEPQLIGMKDNRITRQPLMECVEQTRKVAECVRTGDYAEAMELRGARLRLRPAHPAHDRARAAAPAGRGPEALPLRDHARRRARARHEHRRARRGAPGARPRATTSLGVRNGFRGLVDGDFFEMDWMSVNGWASRGGAELGTNRRQPADRELYAIARQIEKHEIDGILMIGGWSGYEAVAKLHAERERFPAFNLPIICLPASINNNLPGSELSIGSDTALNNIVGAVDKIKTSAVASQRCFVVEVMGRRCGYLALMGGLATGAERSTCTRTASRSPTCSATCRCSRNGFRARQAARAADPQRGREPLLHDALHVRALRAGGRRAVRRAPGDPRPPAAGRRPEPVRPHPGDAHGRGERRVPDRARPRRARPAPPPSSACARASSRSRRSTSCRG